MKTIDYKVSFEKMISRLPGLFAYLDWDDYGEVSLHKATDSLDGCWGRVVENIKLPSGASLVIEENEILKSGNVYSFRTIIDYYYQYKDVLEENDGFLAFVDNGIGKILVPDNIKGKATPKYVYLSNVKTLYNELVKMKKMCDFYHENQEKGLIEEDAHLCCICEKYKNLGGDDFRDYIGDLITEAENRATLFFEYAKDAQVIEKEMTIDFDIDLTSTYQDFGIMTPYAAIWLPYKRYKVGDEVEYDGELYRCNTENTGKWDKDLLTVVFDYDKFDKVSNGMKIFNNNGKPTDLPSRGMKVTGGTDSKLVNLRRFKTYYNDDGVAERPVIGEDWLFYYRKGVVVNIKTINNDLGNVVKLSNMQEASEDPDDLAAYGDVIEDITTNTTERTITFVYRIDAHLKAADTNPTITYDDDNNKLIKWEKFEWDNDEKVGIKYTETYNYEEGSNLEELITDNFKPKDEDDNIIGIFKFENYINGEYDEMIPTFKFEFTTINNTFNYDKTIAHQDVNIVSLLTEYEVYRLDFDEFVGNNLIREDYFNGITYKPTKNIDVRIERGSTSVFDKHIAFGEVKTMDDLISFKNASFFPITKS